MRKANLYGVLIVSFMGLFFSAFADDLLKSGSYAIEQSWSQEEAYERSYHVLVPSGKGPFPVLIKLHGSGGQGERMLRNFSPKSSFQSCFSFLFVPFRHFSGFQEVFVKIDYVLRLF